MYLVDQIESSSQDAQEFDTLEEAEAYAIIQLCVGRLGGRRRRRRRPDPALAGLPAAGLRIGEAHG